MEATIFNPDACIKSWSQLENAIILGDPLSVPALITGSHQISLLISSLGTCISFAASEINSFTGILEKKIAALPPGAAPVLENLGIATDREGRSALEREVWLLQVRGIKARV